MYDFVFWFFHIFFSKKRNDDSSLTPAGMVGVAMIIHVGMLFAIQRYFTGIDIDWKRDVSYGQRKYFFIPMILIALTLIWLIFYRKRKAAIINKYKEKEPFTAKNYVLIALIFIVPLIIGSIFAKLYLG
jgi:hypothetical protein